MPAAAESIALLQLDWEHLHQNQPVRRQIRYRAVLSYLERDECNPGSSAAERFRPCFEIFRFLADLEDWRRAGWLLALPTEAPTRGRLMDELLRRGCARELAELLERLLGHVDVGVDFVCLKGLGDARLLMGDLDRAIDAYERCIEVARGPLARPEEARQVLSSLGQALALRGDLDRGLALQQETLGLARAHQDRALERVVLGTIGGIHLSLGRYEEAESCFEQEVRIATSLEDRAAEAQAIGSLGNLRYALHRYDEARELYSRLLAFAEETGNAQAEMGALQGIANVDLSLGRPVSAIPSLERVVALAERSGSELARATALGSLGNAHLKNGEIELAILAHRRCLGAARAIGASGIEQDALEYLGKAYLVQGDFTGAVEPLEAAAALAEARGHVDKTIEILNWLAQAWARLDRWAEAEPLIHRVRDTARAAGDRVAERRAQLDLAFRAHAIADHDKAVQWFEAALADVDSLRSDDRTLAACLRLAAVYRELDDSVHAAACFAKYLAIAQDTDDRDERAFAARSLGFAYHELGRLHEALDALRRYSALVDGHDEAVSPEAASVLLSIGRRLPAAEQPDLGREALSMAIELFEALERAAKARGNAFAYLAEHALCHLLQGGIAVTPESTLGGDATRALERGLDLAEAALRGHAHGAQVANRVLLAMTLNDTANRLSHESGGEQSALRAAQCAVALLHVGAAHAPDVPARVVAVTLHTLALRLWQLGWTADARDRAKQAVAAIGQDLGRSDAEALAWNERMRRDLETLEAAAEGEVA